MIVIDASVLANAIGDDEEAGRQARDLVRAHRDACYVALAEALGWPLCTADRRLAHASGPRCTMQLITPPG